MNKKSNINDVNDNQHDNGMPLSGSYADLHRPSSEFKTRDDYLNNELQIMQPKRWKPNVPFRDYNFEPEDMIPALAATIGKIVMVGAIAGAYAGVASLGLDQSFILENVRLELVIVALFVFLFSGFILPTANLAGTHGPLIALIPLIVLAGGHPMAFGLLIGLFGFILAITKGGSLLANLTSEGTAGGLLLFLGVTGLIAYVKKILAWSESIGMAHIGFVILVCTILLYVVLGYFKKRWLAIPLSCVLGGGVAFILGAPFEFVTQPGLPNMNPAYWWGETTGWKMGLPNLESFMVVLPFAVLAVAMWSPDFLGHQVFQKMSYPQKTEKVIMDIDDTMTSASTRQIVGSILGGANFTSSWGTYVIPAAIAKRPIPAGAILTAVFCVIAALSGYPMDLAVWTPVMGVALIVGVFLPLLEAGMAMTKDDNSRQSATVVIFASAIVNPAFGWSLAMLLDNTGLTGNKERSASLSTMNRFIIPATMFVLLTIIMGIVGILPGIPAIEYFAK